MDQFSHEMKCLFHSQIIHHLAVVNDPTNRFNTNSPALLNFVNMYVNQNKIFRTGRTDRLSPILSLPVTAKWSFGTTKQTCVIELVYHWCIGALSVYTNALDRRASSTSPFVPVVACQNELPHAICFEILLVKLQNLIKVLVALLSCLRVYFIVIRVVASKVTEDIVRRGIPTRNAQFPKSIIQNQSFVLLSNCESTCSWGRIPSSKCLSDPRTLLWHFLGVCMNIQQQSSRKCLLMFFAWRETKSKRVQRAQHSGLAAATVRHVLDGLHLVVPLWFEAWFKIRVQSQVNNTIIALGSTMPH